jgi:hypothetical protein
MKKQTRQLESRHVWLAATLLEHFRDEDFAKFTDQVKQMTEELKHSFATLESRIDEFDSAILGVFNAETLEDAESVAKKFCPFLLHR